MPNLSANSRSILKAINGGPAVYGIEKHDRLYLDAHSGDRDHPYRSIATT